MEIHEYLHTIDFMVVVLYILVLVGIGYWVSFRKKKKKGENLFLAGRSLSWPSIGLTMWGTNIGPSMLIASAAIGYTTGIVAGNFSWYAFPFLILLSMYFTPKYLSKNISTLPEFIGKRFNSTSRDMFAIYSLITIIVSWLGLTLYAGGILVSQILDLPLWVSVVILIGIAAFFSIAGGLEAIAYTNVFQMILLIVASLAFVIIGLGKLENLTDLYTATPESFWDLFLSHDDENYPWLAIVLGYPVLGIWFWCTDQSMVQSVLGAKNLKQGQLGTNFTAWLKILDVPVFYLPGILCFILYPGLSDPNEAYMTMVTRTLPVGMVGLIMAVLIAALVSTIDSALNSLSTVFTMDIYIKKFKPQATQKETIFTGRLVNVVGAFVGVGMALLIAEVEGMDLFSLFQAILGFLAPPVTALFVVGTLWKRATPAAANFILSAGTLISLGIGVLFLIQFPSEEFWPHFLMLSFFICCGLIALMIGISLFTVKKSKEDQFSGELEINRETNNLKPDYIVVWLWGILVSVMILLYIVFN